MLFLKIVVLDLLMLYIPTSMIQRYVNKQMNKQTNKQTNYAMFMKTLQVILRTTRPASLLLMLFTYHIDPNMDMKVHNSIHVI